MLEAKNLPEDFEVRLSELVLVSHVEARRHTPVEHVSTTSAFTRRTFRLSRAVVTSYSFGPNRTRHALMSRTRRLISSMRSADFVDNAAEV